MNHLFNSCYTLDAILKSDDQQLERDKALPLLKKSLSISKRCYDSIKAKYPQNAQLKNFKLWNDVLDKVVVNLSSENWQSEPMWQLSYTLIKLDLQDLVNQKLE